MLFFLAGCANLTTNFNANEREKHITVGYAINNLNDTFQIYVLNAAKEEAAKDGIQVIAQNAQDDLITQQDIVNGLIENDVDALVVVPVDTSAMDPITKAAQKAGIPLVYVNRNPFEDVKDMPNDVFYVGSNEKEAGTIQGKYVAEALGGKGKATVLTLALGLQSTRERTNGVKEAFSNYQDMSVLNTETAKGQRDQAVTIAENWLQAYGDDLDAIIANNDEMALGAVQALQTTQNDHVIVVGIDATPDGLQAIKDGKMEATVFQNASAQGVQAIKKIAGLSKGEKQDAITFIPFELVTQDNVDDYID